ncbi:MAG: ABC transporter permease, partial [Pseudomonadota bacterium]
FVNGENGRGHHVLVHAAFLVASALALAIYRTPWGLRLRAVGENPDAARAAGISIKKMQYAALAASGLLAGLGGIYLSMGYLNLFQADMAGGRGFLALAAVFLGARRPFGTLAAAVLFGASAVLAAQLGLLQIPSQVVYVIPPLVTVAAMVILGARHRARTA